MRATLNPHDYVGHIETQNFTNGYRIRFAPGSRASGLALHYTIRWWQDSRPHTSTSLNPRKVCQNNFVEFGKWYGNKGFVPDGEHTVEITVYTPEGEEVGTGEMLMRCGNPV